MKNLLMLYFQLLLFSSFAQSGGLSTPYIVKDFLDANMYDCKLPKAWNREFDSTHIVSSKLIKGDLCNGRVGYELKLLQVESGLDCKYGMLFYKDDNMYDYLAFRISGYLENDFIHFYKRVLRHYMSRKKTTEFLDNLQQQDTLFKNVDFDGLTKTIRTNNREMECMKAKEYVYPTIGIRSVNISANWEQIQKEQLFDQVYAYFSNRPFFGELPPIGKYRRRKIE